MRLDTRRHCGPFPDSLPEPDRVASVGILIAILYVAGLILALWFMIVGIRAFNRYLSLNPAQSPVSIPEHLMTPEQRAEQEAHRAMMAERNPDA